MEIPVGMKTESTTNEGKNGKKLGERERKRPGRKRGNIKKALPIGRAKFLDSRTNCVVNLRGRNGTGTGGCGERGGDLKFF